MNNYNEKMEMIYTIFNSIGVSLQDSYHLLEIEKIYSTIFNDLTKQFSELSFFKVIDAKSKKSIFVFKENDTEQKKTNEVFINIYSEGHLLKIGFNHLKFNDDKENDKNFERIFIISLEEHIKHILYEYHSINNTLKMFESFSRAIITALKHKSKHTAHHCEKVPVIAKRIAEKINEDKELFKDVNFDKNDFYQIELASWLHDVGKVAVKDSVLEKSKRLEFFSNVENHILDRIELFKLQNSKDGNKRYWLTELKKAISKSNNQENLNEKERAMVHKCKKLKYLSNGKLLPLITEEEAEALCLKKGTLTKKEKEEMNFHANIGAQILDEIHFPKYLSKVRDIAAHHHEQLNGKGYPFGKKGEELSCEERIMSAADIFEALTAERPYKKPFSDEMIEKILLELVENEHLDKNIVSLCLKNKEFILEKNK